MAVRRSDPSADGRMGVGAVLLSPGEGKGECNMGGGRTKEWSECEKGPRGKGAGFGWQLWHGVWVPKGE